MQQTPIISLLIATAAGALMFPVPRPYISHSISSNTIDTHKSTTEVAAPNTTITFLGVKRETVCEKFCAVNEWMCRFCKKDKRDKRDVYEKDEDEEDREVNERYRKISRVQT
jgi:hypothetical protein